MGSASGGSTGGPWVVLAGFLGGGASSGGRCARRRDPTAAPAAPSHAAAAASAPAGSGTKGGGAGMPAAPRGMPASGMTGLGWAAAPGEGSSWKASVAIEKANRALSSHSTLCLLQGSSDGGMGVWFSSGQGQLWRRQRTPRCACCGRHDRVEGKHELAAARGSCGEGKVRRVAALRPVLAEIREGEQQERR